MVVVSASCVSASIAFTSCDFGVYHRSVGKRAGYELDGWFNDPAVSGADPIDTRPGFAALLERVTGNGVRTVIVEDASRFARQLCTQEAGIALLVGLGVWVLDRLR